MRWLALLFLLVYSLCSTALEQVRDRYDWPCSYLVEEITDNRVVFRYTAYDLPTLETIGRSIKMRGHGYKATRFCGMPEISQ